MLPCSTLFMGAPEPYPTNYQLSQQVSGYMKQCFWSLAFLNAETAAPSIPIDLPVGLSVGMHQMVATLVHAYNHCSMSFQYMFYRSPMFLQLNLVLTWCGSWNRWHQWNPALSQTRSKPSCEGSPLLYVVWVKVKYWVGSTTQTQHQKTKNELWFACAELDRSCTERGTTPRGLM